jgi:chromosome segregation ATPase
MAGMAVERTLKEIEGGRAFTEDDIREIRRYIVQLKTDNAKIELQMQAKARENAQLRAQVRPRQSDYPSVEFDTYRKTAERQLASAREVIRVGNKEISDLKAAISTLTQFKSSVEGKVEEVLTKNAWLEQKLQDLTNERLELSARLESVQRAEKADLEVCQRELESLRKQLAEKLAYAGKEQESAQLKALKEQMETQYTRLAKTTARNTQYAREEIARHEAQAAASEAARAASAEREAAASETIRTLTADKDALERKFEDCKQMIARVVTESNERQEQTELAYDVRIKELGLRAGAQRAEFDAAIVKLSDDAAVSRRTLAEREATVRKLESAVADEADKGRKARAEMEERIGGLTNIIRDAGAKVREEQERADQLQKTFDSDRGAFHVRIDALEVRAARAEASVAVEQSRAVRLEKERDTSNKRITDLENKVSTLKTAMPTVSGAPLTRLKAQLDASNAEIVRLRANFETAASAFSTLQHRFVESGAEVDRLKAELTKATAQYGELLRHYTVLDRAHGTLVQENTALIAEVTALRTPLAATFVVEPAPPLPPPYKPKAPASAAAAAAPTPGQLGIVTLGTRADANFQERVARRVLGRTMLAFKLFTEAPVYDARDAAQVRSVEVVIVPVFEAHQLRRDYRVFPALVDERVSRGARTVVFVVIGPAERVSAAIAELRSVGIRQDALVPLYTLDTQEAEMGRLMDMDAASFSAAWLERSPQLERNTALLYRTLERAGVVLRRNK